MMTIEYILDDGWEIVRASGRRDPVVFHLVEVEKQNTENKENEEPSSRESGVCRVQPQALRRSPRTVAQGPLKKRT